MNIVDADLFDADLVFLASLCFSEAFVEHALTILGIHGHDGDGYDCHKDGCDCIAMMMMTTRRMMA